MGIGTRARGPVGSSSPAVVGCVHPRRDEQGCWSPHGFFWRDGVVDESEGGEYLKWSMIEG